MSERIWITATSALCAAGGDPETAWRTLAAGRSAIAPVREWDSARWPTPLGGEISGFDLRELVPDRRSHKLLRRTDFLGLGAAARAVEASGLLSWRGTLAEAEAASVDDGAGIFVGSGGAAYQNQYDFLPLLAAAAGDLAAFGRELESNVSPMWLLRSLPNNVLCHAGIRFGFKGPNQCFTTHSVSGALAALAAADALRDGEADRALVVAHDTPIEPELIRSFHALGLLASEAIRPFDRRRDGSLLGEGAAALVLETERSARSRGALPVGELLGGAVVSEAEGLLAIREDGDGLARAIGETLAEADLAPADVGVIVAHGNGTVRSDASEALSIRRVFGSAAPPVTAFKWAFGHLIAAAGLLEAVVAVESVRRGVVPAIATLREPAPECDGLPLCTRAEPPRSPVALVLARGFGGTNAVLAIRVLGDGAD